MRHEMLARLKVELSTILARTTSKQDNEYAIELVLNGCHVWFVCEEAFGGYSGDVTHHFTCPQHRDEMRNVWDFLI